MHKEGLLNNGESSGYAFALNNGTYSGLKTVSHAGSLAGYRAQLMRFPDQKFSVIILANRGDFNPTALSFRVADVFLQDQYVSEPEEESEKEAEAEPREASKRFELQHMTGRYEIAPGVIAEISIKDDSLHVLQLWNQSEYNLSRSGNNIFVIPGAGNIQFIFSELNDGHAQILTVFQNGNTTPAKRMPDTDLSGLNLSEYQGEYYSREIDATYHIFIEGDRLRMKIPNNPARDLDPVSMDEFSSERMQLKFNRSDNLVASFEVNVGRVENLKFDKK
jgi:hypothetical protein